MRRVEYSGTGQIEIGELTNDCNQRQSSAMSHSADALLKTSEVELLAAYAEARREFVEKKFNSRKQDLGPGKALALDFAREFLPEDFDDVRDMFGRRGAYRNFRALVSKRRVLERWYDFEAKATKRAVREWCEL